MSPKGSVVTNSGNDSDSYVTVRIKKSELGGSTAPKVGTELTLSKEELVKMNPRDIKNPELKTKRNRLKGKLRN